MTDEELFLIEARHIQAQPDQDGTLSFNAMLESFRDVPALCVEVRKERAAADAYRAECELLKEQLEEAIAHRDDYETRCIEQSIEIRKLRERASTDRLEQAALDELAGAVRYCIEQIARRGWERWSQGTEISLEGRPWHVQIDVQPTGANPWNRSR